MYPQFHILVQMLHQLLPSKQKLY